MLALPRFSLGLATTRVLAACVLMLMSAGLTTGCSSRYVITTNTGAKVITASKPKLVQSNYVYRDASGEKVRISTMRVRQIEPYSKEAAGVPLLKPDLK